MAEELAASRQAPKRRRWLRLLGWIFGVVILLLVLVYFVGTSSMFLKGFVLPQVSKAIHASVTADSISVSPFSSVTVRNLKVQAAGAEPLVTVQEFRARYSLLSIIGGNIKVDELAVVSPEISIVEQPDGSKNIDALLKGQGAETKPAAETKASKPPQVDIAKIAVTGLVFRSVKNYPGGLSDVAAVSNLDLEISNVKNGQSGKLTLGAEVKMDNHPPAPGVAGLMHARLTSDLVFALSDALAPASFKGSTRFEVAQAGGSLANFEKLIVSLDTEATAEEIKQIALHFDRSGATLGEVRVDGPFNLLKSEGHLNVSVRSIDKQILNLAGAKSGMDFGPTTIDSTNQIDVLQAGSVLQAVGGVNISKFSVTHAGQATPTVNATVGYQMTVDSAEGNLRMTNLTILATQNGQPLIKGGLTSPLGLSWGTAAKGVADSTLTFDLSNLNLADWKALAGDACPPGMVSASVKLTSQNEGKSLGFDSNVHIDNLGLATASNRVAQVMVDLKARGKADNLAEFDLTDCQLQVGQQGQPLISATASGTCNTAGGTADLKCRLQVMMARLLETLQLPGMEASSGSIDLHAEVTQKQNVQTVAGAFVLADLTGKFNQTELRGYGVKAEFDLGSEGPSVQIRKFAGGLVQNGRPGGQFTVVGKYDKTDGSIQANVDLTDFNQDGLSPFIEPALGGKKLVSIALNGNALVQSNPQGDGSIKAGVQIANLVVNDPQTQSPTSPLEAKMQIEAATRQKVTDIGRFQLTLSPTARAKNELQLSGRVDMSKSDAITGNLKLAADSLDFTPYYDLMGGGAKSNAVKAPVAQAAAPPAEKSNEEPAAMELPVRNFTFTAEIGQLYLREIEVKQFQTTVKIDGGHVVVNPFQFALNGAPVSAQVDLDMGVPGYKYDVNFSAIKVPQAPLVNSFQPERKGQIGGTATATAEINGAGTTGANLKKNLNGKFSVLSTNLNLSIANVHNKYVNMIVNIIVGIPELVSFKAPGHWLDEFEGKPINLVSVQGDAGKGKVNLTKAAVQSAAFEVGAAGNIKLEDVLTNSVMQIPVKIALAYNLADQIGLVSPGTPTNAFYAPLPDFVTMKGTLGTPVPEIKKFELVKLAGRAVGGIGSNAGKAMGTVGGAFGTNAGHKVESIFNVLKKLSGPKTNAPAPSN